jgi:RND superfamily putative drug exporter
VFSIFATLSLIEFKMFGVAMAAAVLIDATVVRGVLMPAAMSLLGERNWYLPGWLSWLTGRQKTVPALDGAGRKEAAGAATGG